nr:MAG TPA: hypothetical protein [Bacteriophage sp.]
MLEIDIFGIMVRPIILKKKVNLMLIGGAHFRDNSTSGGADNI